MVHVCPLLVTTRGEIDELMAALDDGYAEAARNGLMGGEVKKAR